MIDMYDFNEYSCTEVMRLLSSSFRAVNSHVWLRAPARVYRVISMASLVSYCVIPMTLSRTANGLIIIVDKTC